MTVGAARIGVAEREQARGEAWWMFAAVPMLTAAIGFTWMLREMLQRAYGMTGEAWDLAYDQQVIWNIAQGHGFYTSFARGDFLGIHLEPIFVLLAAIEKFWPSPTVLLILASAGLAAAAPAAYLFFRAILPAGRAESPWLALALAAPIPFWAATQEAARDFFHPENMALAFALLAAWAGIRGHRVAMWALCVLTLTCKEDQVYTVGVLSIVMRVHGAPEIKRHWRFILYLAGAWFLIATGIVQQHFHHFGYTDFVSYRWLVGLDPNMPVSPLAVAQLQAATTVIPSDAPVNADAGLTVWLANRHTINDFPDMLDGSSYVVIDQNTFLGATTSKAKRQQALDGLAAGGRRLLYDDGRFQIWSPVGD